MDESKASKFKLDRTSLLLPHERAGQGAPAPAPVKAVSAGAESYVSMYRPQGAPGHHSVHPVPTREYSSWNSGQVVTFPRPRDEAGPFVLHPTSQNRR